MRSPAHLINQECVITNRTAGPKDPLGNPTWITEDIDDFILVQPVASDEVEDRPAGKFTHRGFLRPESVIFHASKVTIASTRQWEVDGPPRMHIHPPTVEEIYQEVDLVGYADIPVEEDSSSA